MIYEYFFVLGMREASDGLNSDVGENLTISFFGSFLIRKKFLKRKILLHGMGILLEVFLNKN